MSHGNSSRINSSRSNSSNRVVSLGLGNRSGQSNHQFASATDALSEQIHNDQSSSQTNELTNNSPPSPSQASRLTLSLRALSFSPSTPLSNPVDPALFGSPSSPSIVPSVASSSLHSTLTSPDLLSDQLLSIYEQTLHKLLLLRSTERTLSSQSGQLLKALQSEESMVNMLNTTLKRIRHEHKKLLGRISAPRWEVKSHYHMTSIEHSLGHHQPHVMDVAEMLPGHLRLYALARHHALIKRSFTSSTARAKTERNAAAEQIKEGYRQLKETRAEIKELTKLLEFMNGKTHLLNSPEDRLKLESMIRKHRKQLASLSTTASAQQAVKGIGAPRSMLSNSLASPTNASAIRMRYLKSLNLAPKPYEARSDANEAAAREEKRRVSESYNSEWRNMLHLFHQLEQQKNGTSDVDSSVPHAISPPPVATPLANPDAVSVHDSELENEALNGTGVSNVQGELRIVHNYRKRMGLVTLPSPLTFGENEDSLDVRVKDEHDPNDNEAVDATNEDDNQQRDEAIRGLIDKVREIGSPSSPIQTGNFSHSIASTEDSSPKSAPIPTSPHSPTPLTLSPDRHSRSMNSSHSQPNSPVASEGKKERGLFGSFTRRGWLGP